MPPLEKHVQSSRERTGKEYREIHEWMDGDPDKKARRHDVTRIFEFGWMFEEQYGPEAREEYVRHIQEDLKAKFEHLQHDIETRIAETLAYFGVK